MPAAGTGRGFNLQFAKCSPLLRSDSDQPSNRSTGPVLLDDAAFVLVRVGDEDRRMRETEWDAPHGLSLAHLGDRSPTPEHPPSTKHDCLAVRSLDGVGKSIPAQQPGSNLAVRVRFSIPEARYSGSQVLFGPLDAPGHALQQMRRTLLATKKQVKRPAGGCTRVVE